MQTLGALVMWAGLLLMVVGALCFLIAAFREGILWGLGVLFLPVVWLVFLIAKWDRAKSSFLLQLYGVGMVLVAALLLAARLPLIR